MSSWFSGWSPIKSFPPYHGPYDVGTVDVEIPISDLPFPCEAPEDAQPTIAFRVFYPCQKPGKNEVDRPVRWIPSPQRETIAAFAKFLGLSPRMAGAVSYVSQQLYYINLPAHRNAKLLSPPTSNKRWPVTFFSHGLAGSRNMYSQICGDMAANGMVVIALDHRDGSSPIQYVRATASTEAHTVQPVKIPHSPVTNEVYEGRDKQLRIRLWEISMAYEALVKIDRGENVENLDDNTSRVRKERMEVLWQFNDMLDIHRPGKVSWAGHSFGAATTVQLLKSTYYHQERDIKDGKPLMTLNPDAAIIQQVTPESPTLLLDLWGLPLQSPFQKALRDRPLPSYAVNGPEGTNVLSVLSQTFYSWKDNLNINASITAKPPPSRRSFARATRASENEKLAPSFARLREHSPAMDSGYASETSENLTREASHSSRPSQSEGTPGGAAERVTGSHMFYIPKTQHFNQSDFGILFKWLARRLTKAEEPERCLELNIRAVVQVIRDAGIEVAGDGDEEILNPEGRVRNWVPVGDERLGPLSEVDRKLSIASGEHQGAGMDRKMSAEVDMAA